jgi:hypothetical protein
MLLTNVLFWKCTAMGCRDNLNIISSVHGMYFDTFA